MSTYRVTLTSSASFHIDVEADSEDEAIDRAYDEVPSGLCVSCSGSNQGYDLDLDGAWVHVSTEIGGAS